MRRKKEKNDVESSGEDSVLAALDWGAGTVFPRGWKPAYKAGWGGSQNEAYLAEQIVALDIGGRNVGVSAMFMPNEQPANDALGQGDEVEAIEGILEQIKVALSEEVDTGGG